MSITGQVGYVSLAKQTAFGTPNTTAAQYRAVKITGDSLVANNNILVAEGEIGQGRDVTQAVPGGFSAAGAINGNLRVRAGLCLAHGALGLRTAVVGPPAVDEFTPQDDLPVFTIEKKVGTTAPELLILRYVDAMINTLNISVTSGGLSTFSAGIIAAGETKLGAAVSTPSFGATGDDLLVFHGGRILHADTGTVLAAATHTNTTFQSAEVVVNNNVAADEYTIRPSRFLRSLTEGIRSVEVNMTIVFEDGAAYEKYTYGATGNTAPGYSLYMGAFQMLLTNWQPVTADTINTTTIPGVANPQALQFDIPKLAFTGLPVALTSGRIAVSTTARALKPATDIIKVIGRPGNSTEGFNY